MFQKSTKFEKHWVSQIKRTDTNSIINDLLTKNELENWLCSQILYFSKDNFSVISGIFHDMQCKGDSKHELYVRMEYERYEYEKEYHQQG